MSGGLSPDDVLKETKRRHKEALSFYESLPIE